MNRRTFLACSIVVGFCGFGAGVGLSPPPLWTAPFLGIGASVVAIWWTNRNQHRERYVE